MSLFSKMKAAVGIGGAQVEIVALEYDQYYRNETVRGTLTLTGGIEEQTVSNLIVRLTRHSWVPARNGYQDYYEHFSETSLAANLQVTAGSSQQFEFAVCVPECASPSGLDELQKRATWYVEGVAYIRHAVDASEAVEVTICCPASLDTLAIAIEAAASLEIRKRYTSYLDHPLVHFQFAPIDESAHFIDEVKLDIQEKDGQALGTLTITPVQHSLKEHLRAIVGKDDVHHEVVFSLDALSTDEEGNVGDEVAAQLREWFEPYLSDSDETVASE